MKNCKNRYKYLTTFFLSLGVAKATIGQNAGPVFFETISSDSTMIFFNERFKLTEKQCAVYTRFAKVDADGSYNGYFLDVSNGNEVLGTGKYLGGKKNGYFEIYYPTGKMFAKGNYSENNPVGTWYFFYENGLPERTIQFLENE